MKFGEKIRKFFLIKRPQKHYCSWGGSLQTIKLRSERKPMVWKSSNQLYTLRTPKSSNSIITMAEVFLSEMLILRGNKTESSQDTRHRYPLLFVINHWVEFANNLCAKRKNWWLDFIFCAFRICMCKNLRVKCWLNRPRFSGLWIVQRTWTYCFHSFLFYF